MARINMGASTRRSPGRPDHRDFSWDAPCPDGTYRAWVFFADEEEAKSSGRPMLVLKLGIAVPGQDEGRYVRHFVPYHNGERVREFAGAFDVDPNDFDTHDVTNRWVQVRTTTTTGQDGCRQFVNVADLLPLDQSTTATQPASDEVPGADVPF